MMKLRSLAVFLLLGMLALASRPVAAQTTQLKHAYNFDDGTANDRVGGAHGVLHGGAVIENGALVTSDIQQFLELPAEKIKLNTFESVSLEAYVTPAKGNGVNTMLSYFGGSLYGYGVNYLFQSLKNGGISKTSVVGKNQQNPWETETSVHSRLLDDGEKHHVVTTLDNEELRYYIDGVLVGKRSVEFQPDNVLANIGNELAFLCRGGYDSDPAWQGAVHEFNIYEGVLDAGTILASAKSFIPGLDVAERDRFLSAVPTSLVVDTTATFSKSIKGKAVFFAELIPTELDQNNLIEAEFVFSEQPLEDWPDVATSIRFSLYQGHVLVGDGKEYTREEGVATPVKVGQVYQCWISVDVKAKRYSVYLQTPGAEDPVLLAEHAKFRKNVNRLDRWSAIHNATVQADPLQVHAFSEVKQVGDLPEAYVASVAQVPASVFDLAPAEGAEVLERPLHGFVSGRLELRRVDRSKGETALFLRAHHPLQNWIQIPKDTYIRDRESGEKLFLTAAEGIPIGVQVYPSAEGYSDFKLIFPALPESCSGFDYGEDSGSWYVNHIQFVSKNVLEAQPLYGHWSDVNNGNWSFSLLADSVVVFQNQAWDIRGSFPEQEAGQVALTAINEPETSLTLSYSFEEDTLILKDGADGEWRLSRTASYENVPNPWNPPAIEQVFSTDSVVLSGYLYGYSPELGNRTGTVYVNNLLSGNQGNVLFELDDRGFFSGKLPVVTPGNVYIRSDAFNRSLFVEPGEEVFLFLDGTGPSNVSIMGKNARLNLENLASAPFYMNRFYLEIDKKVLDMDADDFKAFCLQKMEEDLAQFEAIKKEGAWSDRYLQLTPLNIKSNYLRNVLHYHYISSSAYRQKFNIPNTQRELPVNFEIPSETSFFSFIPQDLLTDELSALGDSYENFVNAFSYSPLFQKPELYNFSLHDLMPLLADSGLVQPDDRELVKDLAAAIYSAEAIDLRNAFLKKAIKGSDNVEQRLISANERLIQDVVTNRDPDADEHVLQAFYERLLEGDSLATSADLSEDDISFCSAAVAYYSHPMVKAGSKYVEENSEVINDFWSRYAHYRIAHVQDLKARILSDSFGVESSFMGDLMLSQELLRGVVENLSPLTDEQLVFYCQRLNHPFIKEYLKVANEATLEKIEANKKKSSFVLNEVPESLDEAGLDSERLFAALMNKYKGKVVYVDFWATWCGPCRSTMAQQKAMKTSLKDRDIVFVYLTDQSSPEQTYNNMIPDIGGEHYRLTDDQSRVLKARFGVSGIPHFLIVNKAGEVVNYNAPRDPRVLLPIFEELMAE